MNEDNQAKFEGWIPDQEDDEDETGHSDDPDDEERPF